MTKKTVSLALTALLLVSVATFLGVFYGVGKRKIPAEHVYQKAAVAADAGPCSEVGRWERTHSNILKGRHVSLLYSHMHKHRHENCLPCKSMWTCFILFQQRVLMLFGVFPLSCACKWSAKAKIPEFPPEGVSLPHTPPLPKMPPLDSFVYFTM